MPAVQASPTPRPRHASRRRYNASMRFVRRVHMYFGLVLFPFVLIYGVSSLLFNHPGWLSESERRTLGPETLDGLGLGEPGVMADRVLSVLGEEAPAPVRLLESLPPRFEGQYVIDAENVGERMRYRIEADMALGTVWTTPIPGAAEPSPLATGVPLPAAREHRALLARIGGDAGSDALTGRAAPDLTFGVLVGDERWEVACNVYTGRVSARSLDAPGPPTDARTFLTRLHTAHGYPGRVGARWVWAIIVDVTAALMIFWAASGLVMWWQMKPTRRGGAVALAAGMGLAVAIGYAMLEIVQG